MVFCLFLLYHFHWLKILFKILNNDLDLLKRKDENSLLHYSQTEIILLSLIKFLLVNQTFHFFLLWLLTVSLVKHIQKHASPASPSFCLSQFCLPIVLIFMWFPRGKGAVTWTPTGTCPSHSLTVANVQLEVHPDFLLLWYHRSCCHHPKLAKRDVE